MNRILQIVGVLALLSMVAVTAVGLTVLKDRVQITIQDADDGARPDPTAVLRDDLQALTAQLDRLSIAIGDNFGKLHEAVEAAEQERHENVLAQLAPLAGMRAELDRAVASTQRLESALDGLPGAIDARLAAAVAAAPGAIGREPAPAVAAAPSPEPAQVPSRAPEQEPTRVAGAPDSGSSPAAASNSGPVAAGGAPAPRRFLSFSMPDSAFRFGDRQEFAILPELSRVGFDAKSTLHDFTGVTSEVEGAFTADLDDPRGEWQGHVSCTAAALATGVESRDEGLREHLDTGHHPRIRFDLKSFAPAANGIDAAQQTARGEVQGTMTIRGRSRDVRMPVTVSVDPSKRVVIAGEMPLLLSDYEVPVPNKLGLVKMQDEVKVWISLRARGKAAK